MAHYDETNVDFSHALIQFSDIILTLGQSVQKSREHLKCIIKSVLENSDVQLSGLYMELREISMEYRDVKNSIDFLIGTLGISVDHILRLSDMVKQTETLSNKVLEEIGSELCNLLPAFEEAVNSHNNIVKQLNALFKTSLSETQKYSQSASACERDIRVKLMKTAISDKESALKGETGILIKFETYAKYMSNMFVAKLSSDVVEEFKEEHKSLVTVFTQFTTQLECIITILSSGQCNLKNIFKSLENMKKSIKISNNKLNQIDISRFDKISKECARIEVNCAQYSKIASQQK